MTAARSPLPASFAVVDVETGEVALKAGDGVGLDALSTSPPPSSWRVTDDQGRALAHDELPLAAARAGRAYPRRVLKLWRRGRARSVSVSVHPARSRAEAEGEHARAAVLVIDGSDEGASAPGVAHDRFIAVATHELRSPIASLQLDLERLRRRLLRQDVVKGPDIAREMERGIRQVTRLTLLMQNLLDVSNMQARQFSLSNDIEEGDLCAIVIDMVETLRPQATAAGNEVVVAPCEPIFGVWDRLRLEQVLHNLLTNAIKYGGPAGRIDVRVEHDRERNPPLARLTVRDHGPGIPPEDRTRIFDAFERGSHEGDSVAARSLGLGLFIVREIVTAHGGTIRVESPEDGGASFVIELPIRGGERTNAP